MEINELYCDVIVQRWEEFTSQEAERAVAAEKTTGYDANPLRWRVWR